MTDAQKRFLQKRAIDAREKETCCDCPGCETCKGFVRNCSCDTDMDAFREAKNGNTHNLLRAMQSREVPSENE